MLGAPAAPRRLLRQHLLKVGTEQRALERLAGEVTPQRAGLAVKHHQRVANQLAGDAEGQRSPVHVSGIHDARETEWSPGDGDVAATKAVVDDFDPAHEGDREGMSLTPERDSDHTKV